MTLEEFFTALKATTKEINWYICKDGEVRGEVKNGAKFCRHCPVSAVTKNFVDYGNPIKACVDKLQMPIEVAKGIVDVADSRGRTNSGLRQRMLDSLGLVDLG